MSEKAEQQPDGGVVDAQLAAIASRYGERLRGEDCAAIREDLRQLYDAARTLRAFPLTNADEPEALYRPYRRGWWA